MYLNQLEDLVKSTFEVVSEGSRLVKQELIPSDDPDSEEIRVMKSSKKKRIRPQLNLQIEPQSTPANLMRVTEFVGQDLDSADVRARDQRCRNVCKTEIIVGAGESKRQKTSEK